MTVQYNCASIKSWNCKNCVLTVPSPHDTLAPLAAHPSKGSLRTMYDHLQVPSLRGPIIPSGDVCQLVSNVSGRSCLRSSARGDLAVPQSKMSTYGPRSFPVLGPTCWNSLPQSFRDATQTLGQFQRRLKTSLFHLAYGRDLTALHS